MCHLLLSQFLCLQVNLANLSLKHPIVHYAAAEVSFIPPSSFVFMHSATILWNRHGQQKSYSPSDHSRSFLGV